jgi:hypothetical protein
VVVVAAMVGWFFWQNQQRAMASAAELVQAAMHTHAAAVERIYLVDVRRGAAAEELVELPRNVRVATQGDRFWVQMQAQRDWVWGRDEQGAVWITLGNNQAVVVHPEEMGLPLRYIGDLYTLNLETLLASFLRYCRLELSDEAAGLRVITATPRRQWSNRPLRRAVIEVDRDTGVIRRLVLERELERISAVTTFTLVESRVADTSLYGPLGHLSPSGEVFGTETDIGDRRALIVSWFGTRACAVAEKCRDAAEGISFSQICRSESQADDSQQITGVRHHRIAVGLHGTGRRQTHQCSAGQQVSAGLENLPSPGTAAAGSG